MAKDDVIIRFDEVSFEYDHKKPILDEASFSIRRGSKITMMGQNGAGKSSLFKLITRENHPEGGRISIDSNETVAIAKQVFSRDQLELTVQQFFETAFREVPGNIVARIKDTLEIVNLTVRDPIEKTIKSFSGGQQARLLLAYALIQNPDILLLDEPTNNLDYAGIEHLTSFILNYPNTCLVISHDADFLNSFSDGVVYLDIFTHKTEQYSGNYYDVMEEVTRRIEQEQRKNARLEKDIKHRKEQANFFAQKGGKLRNVAKKMRETIDDLEENKADVRREDKTIRSFTIPAQSIVGSVLEIRTVSIMKNHEPTVYPVNMTLKKNQHLLVSGPNGIGKTTFLESLTAGNSDCTVITEGVKVGYYRQDFSHLDFNITAYEVLRQISDSGGEEEIRRVAAQFLLTGELLKHTVSSLSEGQKGLLAFARLVLEKPGLLILDEPTNHINFRHIPVIAEALNQYEGTMILVSHVPEFWSQIRIDEVLDLGSL
jgi:ATPase subunit of ABC transporter with duplicated ATPase domains